MSYYLKSKCCKEAPDEDYYFNFTWKLGTCIKCKEKTEVKEDDDDA